MNGYKKICDELRLNDLYFRSDIIVAIRCGTSIINELLLYDGSEDVWTWENDWWEGEEQVELIGATYVDWVDVRGNQLRYE